MNQDMAIQEVLSAMPRAAMQKLLLDCFRKERSPQISDFIQARPTTPTTRPHYSECEIVPDNGYTRRPMASELATPQDNDEEEVVVATYHSIALSFNVPRGVSLQESQGWVRYGKLHFWDPEGVIRVVPPESFEDDPLFESNILGAFKRPDEVQFQGADVNEVWVESNISPSF